MNEFVARNGLISQGNIIVSGSITSTGTVTISGSIASASFATTAATASSADSLLVRSTLTAQTLVVQTITSSVDFVTGSTQFGSLLTNTHVFSGSVTMNPNGLFVSSSGVVGIGTTSPGNLLHLSSSSTSATGIRFTLGSEARNHYLVSTTPNTAAGRDLGLLAWRSLTLKAGDGVNEGEIYVNAYENIYLNTSSSYTTRLFVSSSGRIGIGTITPSHPLHLYTSSSLTTPSTVKFENAGSGDSVLELRVPGTSWYAGIDQSDTGKFKIGQDALGTTDRLTINGSGNVGIGTTNPEKKLTVNYGSTTLGGLLVSGSARQETIFRSSGEHCFLYMDSLHNNIYLPKLFFQRSSTTYGVIGLERASSSDPVGPYTESEMIIGSITNTPFSLQTSGSRRIVITGDGNVGIGTTSPSTTLTVEGANKAFPLSYNSGYGNVHIQTNETTATQNFGGSLTFGGLGRTSGPTEKFIFAAIAGRKESTTSGDPKGYLQFSTLSDDTNQIKERMRITSGGNVLIGKNTTASATVGINLEGSTGFGGFTRGSGAAMNVNRQNDDGDLVVFMQADTPEGSISVSGTTVSYNGGHLSRYSQTESNQRIEGLLKGTVMSNLDQMAEWINPETGEPYPNEQLNCMKISDVEGDVNVAGVFVNWDEDDKAFTNDMNIAMTGDMIIRIAQSVTVQRGDLLISAGDGTAKPQSDDIRRSNTIAKVTSNHVTCTYEDGSYCVPCVLMAC